MAHGTPGGPGVDTDIKIANGRVIALEGLLNVEHMTQHTLRAQNAKLLEALKECMERLAASQPPEGGITAQVVAQARAAIKEAEGEG